ncbi:hypothetical protein [Ralstonia phage RP13]|nr:hypothetical protein [Ralstonia phage RP13]
MSKYSPVLLRITLLLHCIATWNLSINSGDSLLYAMTHNTSWLCYVIAWALLPLSILGLIDTFINDICPKNIFIKYALKNRHYLHMALSICFGILIFNVVFYGFDIAAILYLAIQAIFIPLAAIDDVIHRYGKPCGESTGVF